MSGESQDRALNKNLGGDDVDDLTRGQLLLPLDFTSSLLAGRFFLGIPLGFLSQIDSVFSVTLPLACVSSQRPLLLGPFPMLFWPVLSHGTSLLRLLCFALLYVSFAGILIA